MRVLGLSAFVIEAGHLLDGASTAAVVISTKSQFVFDGIHVILVILEAITLRCLPAHTGEEMTYGVDRYLSFLLPEILIHLAEAWPLPECSRCECY